jgi:mono/diheme cytochrome c family protein
MKNRARWLLAAAAALWVCSAGYSSGTQAAMQVPPAGRSSSLHIYTEAQARRGQLVVVQSCASCHSEDLNGGEGSVNLSGDRFLYQWGQVSLGELASIIQTTMPVYAPNTLTVQQSTDVVAYVLWLNEYPAGDKELAADLDALKKITLQTPAEHFRLFTQ